jgi:hypothetical protein
VVFVTSSAEMHRNCLKSDHDLFFLTSFHVTVYIILQPLASRAERLEASQEELNSMVSVRCCVLYEVDMSLAKPKVYKKVNDYINNKISNKINNDLALK